jgi:hypothetical protein
MNTKIGGELKNPRVYNMHFLTHPHKPIDRYSEYLSRGAPPLDMLSNPRNFFDDSNTEDQKWLKITRKYLNRLK